MKAWVEWGGLESVNRRLACSPETWPVGIALTYYGGHKALGFRTMRFCGTGRKWALDVFNVAVHGWIGRGEPQPTRYGVR